MPRNGRTVPSRRASSAAPQAVARVAVEALDEYRACRVRLGADRLTPVTIRFGRCETRFEVQPGAHSYDIEFDGEPVDVVVNGHDHLYEVFAEQNPQGFPEPGRGIREFIVGTGGAPSYRFVANKPNSQRQITNRYAVIRFTLLADSYQWSLLEAPNGGVLDSGTGSCH